MLCQECQSEIPNSGLRSPSRSWRGRPALYCSTACRVRAHRRRKRASLPQDPVMELRQRVADLTAQLTSTVADLTATVSSDGGPLPQAATQHAARAAKLANRIARLTAALAEREQWTSPR